VRALRRPLVLLLCALLCGGCNHALRVTNLGDYAVAARPASDAETLDVRLTPFSGTAEARFWFDAIVERLRQDPGIGELRSADEAADFEADRILAITPSVRHHSSGWNFWINWPGFLIFFPASHGYMYRVDVMTGIAIYDAAGRPREQIDLPVSYRLRHADMDRATFANMGWLFMSFTAFVGGIWNVRVFDDRLIEPTHEIVRDNYADFVSAEIVSRLNERSLTRSQSTLSSRTR